MTKTAENLQNLVQTLEKRNSLKTDYVVPAQKLIWTSDNEFIVNTDAEQQLFYKPTELFESQIAEKLGIPMAYFKKMKDKVPALLQENINQWLSFNKSKKYLVRGLNNYETNINTGRAFLSDGYNIIDDYDVLFAALDAIKQTGVKVEITKAEVSDTRLYLHVTCPDVELQAEEFLKGYLKENDAAGNGIISGFVLTNSEVGKGAFEIRPRAVICKCNNGLIVKDERFRKIHLGSKLEAGEIVWSDETRKKNHDLVISQVKDAVNTYLSPEYLGVMINKIAELKNIQLKHTIDSVQNVCKTLDIPDKHKAEILEYFIKDGDHTAAGIFGAVTREAQNMDLDLQFDVEGRIVDLMFNVKGYDKPFSKN